MVVRSRCIKSYSLLVNFPDTETRIAIQNYSTRRPRLHDLAFFALALYVGGLILLAFVVDDETTVVTDPVMDDHHQLSDNSLISTDAK